MYWGGNFFDFLNSFFFTGEKYKNLLNYNFYYFHFCCFAVIQFKIIVETWNCLQILLVFFCRPTKIVDLFISIWNLWGYIYVMLQIWKCPVHNCTIYRLSRKSAAKNCLHTLWIGQLYISVKLYWRVHEYNYLDSFVFHIL